MIDTLKQDFQIPIHHYFQVDFESFQGIVDAMGGVPIYIDAPSKDEKSGFEFFPPYDFHPGCYTFNGADALAYVRARDMQEYIDGRWQFPDRDAPDLHRIQRQQTFLRRLASEAFRQSVKSPLTANEIADKTVPKLKADDSLSRDDINKLITSFRKVDPNDPNSLQTVTVPTVAGPTTKALGSVLDLKQTRRGGRAGAPAELRPVIVIAAGAEPSEIRLRVFNGSGQSGIANRAGTALQQQGFVNVGVGNQSRTSVTEVRYRPGSLDKARVVQSYLGGVGRLAEDKTVVEADVSIVLGRDFQAITPPPNAATAAPETTAAPPTSTSARRPRAAPRATRRRRPAWRNAERIALRGHSAQGAAGSCSCGFGAFAGGLSEW